MCTTEGIYYTLQQQKVKSLKRITTTCITELEVVWSVCSTCIGNLVATVTHYAFASDVARSCTCKTIVEVHTEITSSVV